MKYGICTVAAAPARKEPGHRNEMVNQLLFGECVEVLDQQQEWLHIRSLADDYPGWVTEHMIEEAPVDTATASCRYVASGLVNPVTLPDQLVNAPMGSFLTGYDEETRLLWDERHKYHGTFRTAGQAFDEDLLRRLIQAWLNAPYLWGGKTFMGVDCSGFVQVVLRVLGVRLSRDAWQQQQQGTETDYASRKPGDLAFFRNDEGRITHVGIVVDDLVVHASGKVRMDYLDAKGIVNRESYRLTHQLHSLKRFL